MENEWKPFLNYCSLLSIYILCDEVYLPLKFWYGIFINAPSEPPKY